METGEIVLAQGFVNGIKHDGYQTGTPEEIFRTSLPIKNAAFYADLHLA